jgi:multidrug resistance efflux pump
MKRIGKFILPLLAACMLLFAVLHVVKAQQVPAKPPPPVEPPRSPFGKCVAGAGITEAVNENVSIGASIAGVVEEVYVPVEKVGQTVKAGQPLFLVDSRALKAQLAYQEANVQAAQRQWDRLKNQPRPEELAVKKAAIEVAEANVNLQTDLANRARRLAPSGAMSAEDISQRLLAVEVAKQQLSQSQADYTLMERGAWQYDLDIAKAAVDLAKAQVDQTKKDLERLLVTAPKDGVVLQVNVRTGEYVGTPPSQALVVLGDTHKKVHVRVDIDEHDIPRFKAGAPAKASVRGSPQEKYPMTFQRVEPYVIPKKSLTGDNTERVDTRVLQVIYELDTTSRPIYVGQQLDVFIDVEPGETTASLQ